jgi:CBS domain-containing protein
VKLVLTIITFGCKVPSGIITPSLDAGALFGRFIDQAVTGISPGIFAMVGAATFLSGVLRMTVSLTVVMFQLTGEVDYIPPFVIAILIAKWVADALSSEGVYDLAQTVLGHPFLDPEYAVSTVRDHGVLVEELIPPAQTMREITVDVSHEFKVLKSLLKTKLSQLKARGLMDAGLVLVDSNHMLHGYLAEGELDFAIHQEGLLKDDQPVDLLEGPLSTFVDRTPLTISAKAPMEYAVEMFGKLGLRHIIVVKEGSSKVVGLLSRKDSFCTWRACTIEIYRLCIFMGLTSICSTIFIRYIFLYHRMISNTSIIAYVSRRIALQDIPVAETFVLNRHKAALLIGLHGSSDFCLASICLLILICQICPQGESQNPIEKHERGADGHSLDVVRPFRSRVQPGAQDGTTLAYHLQDSNAGSTLGIRALVVEDPWKNVGDAGEDAGRGEEDGEIADAGALDGCEEDIAGAADEGQADEHDPSLLRSVCDISGADTEEEGEEVGWSSKALSVDVAISHASENGR